MDGLKLKTPIAFQKDSNLDMIPIRKEGMAVCEKCGAIGVKHSFYTKERRFCSQACAKSFNETIQMNTNNTGSAILSLFGFQLNDSNFYHRETTKSTCLTAQHQKEWPTVGRSTCLFQQKQTPRQRLVGTRK